MFSFDNFNNFLCTISILFTFIFHNIRILLNFDKSMILKIFKKKAIAP